MHSIILTTFLCCSTQPKSVQEQYIEALHLADQDPTKGLEKCAELTDQALKQDCQMAAIEKLAKHNPQRIKDHCPTLSGVAISECYFIAAEISKDPSDCEKTSEFSLDCKLHLLSQNLLKVKNINPSTKILQEFHLPEDSTEGWTAIFRIHHMKQRILDLQWCETVPKSQLCRKAGMGLFHERLNIARDKGTFSCTAKDHSKPLRYVPDQEIESALQQRKQQELCP